MATVGIQQPPRPQLLQVPSSGKRPALLRRKTREAFQAQTSIHRMKRNKEEDKIVGINVRLCCMRKPPLQELTRWAESLPRPRML